MTVYTQYSGGMDEIHVMHIGMAYAHETKFHNNTLLVRPKILPLHNRVGKGSLLTKKIEVCQKKLGHT